MKDIERLQAEGELTETGEGYATYSNVFAIGVVASTQGESVGLLVEPMDIAPFVIELGPVAELRALGKYILEVADKLE